MREPTWRALLRAGLAFAFCATCAVPMAAARESPLIPAPERMPEADARFYAFLREFRGEAIEAGIERALYDRAVSGIALNVRVKELNEFQPEYVRPIWEYLATAVSDARVSDGLNARAANAALFDRLERIYGVQREVLAALWGVESGYGESQGPFNLFEALATLGYDGPRKDYGRRQLLAALKIAQQEHLDPRSMTGSWAGAIGHTQFVPTTFLEHAVDGDGDGRRDLSNSVADALASAANYLKEKGWREGASWGEEVRLPGGFAYELADPEIRKSRDEWARLGLSKANGEALAGGQMAAVSLPAGHRGPAFLTFDNFEALISYNASAAYALAIGLLSDRLNGAAGVAAAWPTGEQLLARDQVVQLQGDLKALGLYDGAEDGLLGRRTRGALRQYQKSRGLPADGFVTLDLFYRVLSEVHSRAQ